MHRQPPAFGQRPAGPTVSDHSCHCLCGKTHPSQDGICTGNEDTRLTFSLDGQPVHVPMCMPCLVATLAERQSPGDQWETG